MKTFPSTCKYVLRFYHILLAFSDYYLLTKKLIDVLLCVCVWEWSEELSHMLYAAADMVLIPSVYEPCGLSQMLGMRYGAVCASIFTTTTTIYGIFRSTKVISESCNQLKSF